MPNLLILDKYYGIYKNASIIKTSSGSQCVSKQRNITLRCVHNESKGICVWKKDKAPLNDSKVDFCDNKMCCISIPRFKEEHFGLYTCFMYGDVRKAVISLSKSDQIVIRSETSCNGVGMANKINVCAFVGSMLAMFGSIF